MKITYEVGDYATVEDNENAGELAACDVKLLRKEGNKWYCENFSPWGPPYGYVNEFYLSP